MNETTKTITFMVAGALLAGLAVLVHFQTQPRQIDEFALVGEEFFPEFDSPSNVRFLQVEAFNFEKREPKTFRVEYEGDRWKIASHYDYPAEAADRIARTAASVMGVRREALAGRRESEHERYGVVDPSSDEAKSVSRSNAEAVGIRVTLGEADDEPLVDYIIGKEVELNDEDDVMLRQMRGEEAPQPRHYVRRPDEEETYIATISVDASTKFVDWIEPDLLLLQASDLKKLVIDDYSLEEKIEEVELVPGSGIVQQVKQVERVDVDTYTLQREGGFGPWQFDGLNAETEEIKTSTVNQVASALDNFQIQGVRPRYQIDGQPILNAELKLEFPDSIQTQAAAQRALEEVAIDLESKGFSLRQDPSDRSNFALVANQGELSAGTNDGLMYRLYFGDVFRGDEDEIELGSITGSSTTLAGSADDEASASAEERADRESTSDEETAENDESTSEAGGESDSGEEDASGEAKSRFLLVRVEFDESLLGPRPTPPQPPAKPAPMDDPPTPPMPPASDDGKDQAGEQESEDPQDAAGATGDAGNSSGEPGNAGGGTGNDQSGTPAPSAGEDGLQWVSAKSPQETQEQQEQKAAEKQEQQEQQQAEQQQDEQGQQKSQADETPPRAPAVQQSTEASSQEPAAGVQEETETPVDPQAEYEQALAQFERDQAQYQRELADYEQRLQQGQERVRLLNERFEDWYYIISAESLDTLRLSRSDLVQDKPAEDEATQDAPGEGSLPPSLTPRSLPDDQ